MHQNNQTLFKEGKMPQQKNSKGSTRFSSPKAASTLVSITRVQSPQNANQKSQISFSGAEKGLKLGKNHHKTSRSMKFDRYDAGDNFTGKLEYLNNPQMERGAEENSARFNEKIHNIFCKVEEQTDRSVNTFKNKENMNNPESMDIRSDAEALQVTSRGTTDRSSNEIPKENTDAFGSLYLKILDESPLLKNMTYKEKKQEMKKLNRGSYRSFGEGLDSITRNDLKETEDKPIANEIHKQRSKRDHNPLHIPNANTFHPKEIQELETSTASRSLKSALSFAVATKNKSDSNIRTKDPALSSTVKSIAQEESKNGIKLTIERPKRVIKQVNEDHKETQESSKDKYIPSMLRCYKDNKKKYSLASNNTTSSIILQNHKAPESADSQMKGIKNIIQKIKSTDSLQFLKRPETSNFASKQLNKFRSYVQQENGFDEQIMKRYLNSSSKPKQNLLELSNINRRGINGERKASLRQKVANLTELDLSKQRPDFDKSSFTTKNIGSPMEKISFLTPNGNQSKINIRPDSGVWNMRNKTNKG